MLDRELAEVVQLAEEAGALLLDVYDTDYAIESKGEEGPVTAADKLVNEFLVARLQRLFPGDMVIGEESVQEQLTASSTRCWFVDPLDGTKEFIKKNGEFSVMIGLSVRGEAQLGVVFQPTTGKMYRGVVGEGAFLIHEGITTALHVQDVPADQPPRLIVSRSHRSKQIDALVADLKIETEVACGSVGLKVGLIAEKVADVYVHFYERIRPWDACGPEAIFRAAGGVFVDHEGESLVYQNGDVKNRRGLVACAPQVLERVLKALRLQSQTDKP